jgi:hypothetical protein
MRICNSIGAIDRRSWEHLISFLDNSNIGGDGHEAARIVVTELELNGVELISDPVPDGGLNVLKDFFARSDTMVTKVTIEQCNLGTTEEASQLLAAFHTNRTVTRLYIQQITNMDGDVEGEDVALGSCLSGLLLNIVPQLQHLGLSFGDLDVEAVRAFQPGLQTNRSLKQLSLVGCSHGDESFRLIADALVGNTTIEYLDISVVNYITCSALDDITRMIESTRLQTIIFAELNDGFFEDDASNKRFPSIQKNPNELKLPGVWDDDGAGIDKIEFDIISNCLLRNKCLKHADLFLSTLSTPPPTPSTT